MKHNGLIAIDIDGTLTAVRDALSQEVIEFLQKVQVNGWKLLFVTGRTLDWSLKLLHCLPFEFYLSVFNGAYTIEYPEKHVIRKCFLSLDHVLWVVQLVQNEDVGIVLYGAPDKDSRSFFYQKFASSMLVQHLLARQKAMCDAWSEVDKVMDLPSNCFASIRLFCLPHTAKKLSQSIEEITKLHAPVMKDSYDEGFSVVQVTHSQVSKGHALDHVLHYLGKKDQVIVCGDDYNDISMLKKADVAVVMAQAPSEVLALADIVAPTAKNNGIIQGLNSAFALIDKTGL